MAIESADEFVRLRYSDDRDDYTRAATEPASTEVWNEVIERYPDARFWVAQNKTVPLEILAILASDPDAQVRRMVAAKRKLTPELLASLASDEDDAVRMSVARHKNTPHEILENLRSDSWSEVRLVASQRLKDC